MNQSIMLKFVPKLKLKYKDYIIVSTLFVKK